MRQRCLEPGCDAGLFACAFRAGLVSATTVRTFSPNEMREGFFGQSPYRVLSTSHVKEATGSATSWFLGAPKKAFLRLYAWDIETMQVTGTMKPRFFRAAVRTYSSLSPTVGSTPSGPRAAT
jgi:hypothetical protein